MVRSMVYWEINLKIQAWKSKLGCTTSGPEGGSLKSRNKLIDLIIFIDYFLIVVYLC